MQRQQRFTWIIIILTGLLTTVGGLLANLAVNQIPQSILPYVRFAWPLLGVVTLAVFGLNIWQKRIEMKTELPVPTLGSQNRQRLIEKVRAFWVKGVLEKSLHGAALIELGLYEQPDAVANPWHLVLQQPDQSPQPIPAGSRITQVYDDAGGELLILGEPGSGKTTLLLELARNLLERAQKNDKLQIPV